MRALLFKELREHRWVVLAMWGLCALGLTVLLKDADDDGSPLVAFRNLVSVFGVLLTLALANRLVVREYSGRTQLFLETLPVSRAQVLAVKWLTGATLIAIPMALGLVVTLRFAADEVVLTSRFVALVALRGGSFLLFFYALAFLIGLLGRYRYILWILLVFVAAAADAYLQLPVEQWPPLQLVASSMAFERQEIPYRDLIITWGITALLVSTTFTLALALEGSLVVTLARRMTPRETIGVVVVMLAIVFSFSMFDARKPKPQFAVKNAVRSEGTFPAVAVARVARINNSAARQLAQQLSEDLQGLKEYLTLTKLPSVSVLPDASIDSDLFLRAALPDSDGVVLRGAIGSEHFDQESFRAYAVVQVLDWYTLTRAQQEDRRWLLDGFAQWWFVEKSPSRSEQLTLRAAVAEKILRAGSGDLDLGLTHWLTTREQLGDCLGDALAWRATSLLAQEIGPERFQALARSVLAVSLPNDARAPLLEPSFAALLERSGAPSVASLSVRLQHELSLDQARLEGSLKAIELWPVAFESTLMRGTSREVRYSVGNADAAPKAFSIRYLEIAPWEAEISRAQMARVDDIGAGVLPRSFATGTRLFTALEMHNLNLACTLRLGARRWEVR